MTLRPPMRFGTEQPSPRKGPGKSKSSPRLQPGEARTPRSAGDGGANQQRWPVSVVPHPPRASAGVAQCVLRLDALPIRCMAADERLIYLAEAPLRGKVGTSGHAGRLSAREPRSGKVSRTLTGGGTHLSCLMITSSEGHLWSGTFDGVLRVSRRGGQALHEARAHASSVHALAEAVEAVFSAGGDFLVRAWSFALVPLRTLRAHTAAVHCVAAPGGVGTASSGAYGAGGAGEVWSGGDDHAIHVWTAKEAEGFPHAAIIEEHTSPLRVVAPQHGSPPRVWVADAAGSLRVYDAPSRSTLRTLVSAGSGKPPTTCVVCTHAAVWVGDASGAIAVYDAISTAPLARLEECHSGPVAGLATPVAPVHGSSQTAKAASAVVWSYGSDSCVRGWGMSEQLHDRVKRTREAIDAQHQTMGLVLSTLPRASAAAHGRLEAAAQRAELLTRRMLDLEVSIGVDGGTGGGSAASRGESCIGSVYEQTPAAAGGHWASGRLGEAETHANGAVEYDASLAVLADAQREVATEVEQALLALRGRVDQLLSFAQGHRQATDHDSGAASLQNSFGAPMTSSYMPAQTQRPREAKPVAEIGFRPTPVSIAQPEHEHVNAPLWASPPKRSPAPQSKRSPVPQYAAQQRHSRAMAGGAPPPHTRSGESFPQGESRIPTARSPARPPPSSAAAEPAGSAALDLELQSLELDHFEQLVDALESSPRRL